MENTQNSLRRSLLLLILALVLALPGCSSSSRSPKVTRSTTALKVTEIGKVVFESGGRTVRIKAEVVRSNEDQMKGLMYREELCATCGMLFVYPAEENHTFWMKNTYISLDMIFIDARMQVAGAVENAPPMTEDSQTIDTPSRFVLEVNSGFVKKHGIKAGASVKFEGIKTN